MIIRPNCDFYVERDIVVMCVCVCLLAPCWGDLESICDIKGSN